MSDDAVPPEQRRLILSFALPDTYAPHVRTILGRMGYAIVSREEWEQAEALAARVPELVIVDERRLSELPQSPPSATLPAILISAQGAPPAGDRRVLGATLRPAGLHALYRLLQQALEATARSCLRVPTQLAVRLRHGRREWQGALLSLSENGCLVRTPEQIALGTELEVAFALPRGGLIQTRAETAYRLVADTGLVFQATPPASRRAIVRFVEQQLAA
jgi:hypothetical protein